MLKEYEESGKSSVFMDKRIGEQNEQLGEFDKAIIRSQRERQVLKIYTIDYLLLSCIFLLHAMLILLKLFFLLFYS